jgi:hypothetical protein
VRPFWLLFSCLLFSSGCTSVGTNGNLGTENSRRVVIVGENVDPNLGIYYQKKYDALVWLTSYKGKFAHEANNLFQSGLLPSVAMRSLIKELKSINHTAGPWEIIVPGIAENYFLATLKAMENHSLSKARGIVILIDSKNNRDIEVQLKRVTDGFFFVSYEFHKE